MRRDADFSLHPDSLRVRILRGRDMEEPALVLSEKVEPYAVVSRLKGILGCFS